MFHCQLVFFEDKDTGKINCDNYVIDSNNLYEDIMKLKNKKNFIAFGEVAKLDVEDFQKKLARVCKITSISSYKINGVL